MALLFYILHSILLPQSRELFGVCILHPVSHKNVDTLLTNNDFHKAKTQIVSSAERWLKVLRCIDM